MHNLIICWQSWVTPRNQPSSLLDYLRRNYRAVGDVGAVCKSQCTIPGCECLRCVLHSALPELLSVAGCAWFSGICTIQRPQGGRRISSFFCLPRDQQLCGLFVRVSNVFVLHACILSTYKIDTTLDVNYKHVFINIVISSVLKMYRNTIGKIRLWYPVSRTLRCSCKVQNWVQINQYSQVMHDDSK